MPRKAGLRCSQSKGSFVASYKRVLFPKWFDTHVASALRLRKSSDGRVTSHAQHHASEAEAAAELSPCSGCPLAIVARTPLLDLGMIIWHLLVILFDFTRAFLGPVVSLSAYYSLVGRRHLLQRVICTRFRMILLIHRCVPLHEQWEFVMMSGGTDRVAYCKDRHLVF